MIQFTYTDILINRFTCYYHKNSTERLVVYNDNWLLIDGDYDMIKNSTFTFQHLVLNLLGFTTTPPFVKQRGNSFKKEVKLIKSK